ncbi:MAG TPA: SpoIIE family protein phosphatase [Vicinamibacterales bacterium]|nr:SpoIIE family protein phosphatase [Vicinamibacterales bacterium]
MMTPPRLVISRPDGTKDRVELDRDVITLGRRSECTVRLNGTDVSRDHADITSEARGFVLRDKGSRFGTFVNDQKVTEHVLEDRDQIRLGNSTECEITFLAAGADSNTRPVQVSGDFRQIAALLESLRRLGSGRVLDDVLTMVIDSSIDVTGAERGFIMLAGTDGTLDFKMGRGRGRVTLPGRTFETSRKIPDEVFATGESRLLDFADAMLAQAHTATMMIGIRHVLCVPLVLVRYVDQAEAYSGESRIGVLYLDSREGGVLKSPATRSALETLAGEAAVAIENARLYREASEKARLEQELRIAAEIQQALMPPAEHEGTFCDVAGATVPCRAIGGDFFDYLELEGGSFGVALGDVSGKGAPAALLTAAVQGMFTVEADVAAGPAGTIAKINRGLKQRNIESKFVTMFFGVLSADGSLVYCNGGHNAPVLLSRGGVSRLETGGMILGMFDFASYDQEKLVLEPGDTLVIFSDGISEAQSPDGEEYGDDRLIACLEANRGAAPAAMREALLASARTFAAGAMQSDDMTVLIVRYGRA